jgi:hypothetical protein
MQTIRCLILFSWLTDVAVNSESEEAGRSAEAGGNDDGSCRYKVLKFPRIPLQNLTRKAYFAEVALRRPFVVTGVGDFCAPYENIQSLTTLCDGSVKIPRILQMEAMSPSTGTRYPWAGLRLMREKYTWDEFIGLMREPEQEPLYAMGYDLVDSCPWWYRHLKLPAIMLDSVDYWNHKKSNLPCFLPTQFELFAAMKGMTTDLHIDSSHNAFFSVVCEGSKDWFVVSPDQLMQHIDHFRKYFGHVHKLKQTLIVDKFLHSIGNVFSDSHALCNVPSLEVYRDRLVPGELLYIPPSAPHAAYTEVDTVMVSYNYYNSHANYDIFRLCDRAPSDSKWLCDRYTPRILEHLRNIPKQLSGMLKERFADEENNNSLEPTLGCQTDELCTYHGDRISAKFCQQNRAVSRGEL